MTHTSTATISPVRVSFFPPFLQPATAAAKEQSRPAPDAQVWHAATALMNEYRCGGGIGGGEGWGGGGLYQLLRIM